MQCDGEDVARCFYARAFLHERDDGFAQLTMTLDIPPALLAATFWPHHCVHDDAWYGRGVENDDSLGFTRTAS